MNDKCVIVIVWSNIICTCVFKCAFVLFTFPLWKYDYYGRSIFINALKNGYSYSSLSLTSPYLCCFYLCFYCSILIVSYFQRCAFGFYCRLLDVCHAINTEEEIIWMHRLDCLSIVVPKIKSNLFVCYVLLLAVLL